MIPLISSSRRGQIKVKKIRTVAASGQRLLMGKVKMGNALHLGKRVGHMGTSICQNPTAKVCTL